MITNIRAVGGARLLILEPAPKQPCRATSSKRPKLSEKVLNTQPIQSIIEATDQTGAKVKRAAEAERV